LSNDSTKNIAEGVSYGLLVAGGAAGGPPVAGGAAGGPPVAGGAAGGPPVAGGAAASVTVQPTAPPPSTGTTLTANRLAYVLIISFFLIAAIPLAVIFGGSADTMKVKTSNAIEWIKGVSAYLAGLIGAVVGYYYRTAQNAQ
jgi:hypothetical protein